MLVAGSVVVSLSRGCELLCAAAGYGSFTCVSRLDLFAVSKKHGAVHTRRAGPPARGVRAGAAAGLRCWPAKPRLKNEDGSRLDPQKKAPPPEPEGQSHRHRSGETYKLPAAAFAQRDPWRLSVVCEDL